MLLWSLTLVILCILIVFWQLTYTQIYNGKSNDNNVVITLVSHTDRCMSGRCMNGSMSGRTISTIRNVTKHPFRCLAVILFHDDEDIVDYQIQYMKDNDHTVLAFDHNSKDKTVQIIEERHPDVEFIQLPKDLSFKHVTGVFYTVSREILKRKHLYDWVTFVESDEVLEGPNKSRRYVDFLYDVHLSPFNFVRFENFVFWTTLDDDPSIPFFRDRVRHYAFHYTCAPRHYAWRANDSNLRYYNHNPPNNPKLYPIRFRTNHYPCRSREQMIAKIEDRANQAVRSTNAHYTLYKRRGIDNLIAPSTAFHRWDGKSELIEDHKFSWDKFLEGKLHFTNTTK